MAEDDQGRVKDNFGPHYDKLASIKRKYDPGNLFHMSRTANWLIVSSSPVLSYHQLNAA